MSNYLSERFVSVELLQSDESGLKIPETSIVEKDVYKIPLDYIINGINQSTEYRIHIQKKDTNGNDSLQQIKPTIYFMDDKYAYIDPEGIEDSDVLVNPSNNNTIAASLLEATPITGVYFANQGIAEFRHITILKKIDEFVLIKTGEELKAYDNIVLNSSDVVENQILY